MVRDLDGLPQLTNEEIKRYSRHLIMPEVGVDGQRRLKAGSVLCIGAGGLGSPAAMYLAAAGVGRIGIVDFDVVDFSNLQRQIIHGTSSIGKTEAGVGEGAAGRHQSAHPDRYLRDRAVVGERARTVRAVRRHPRRHGQLPDALPDERRVRAARQAERLRQHLPLRGSGVGVRGRRTARATAACTRNRRHPVWCRAAPKAACWACCPASSASSRRPRRSSSSPASASR